MRAGQPIWLNVSVAARAGGSWNLVVIHALRLRIVLENGCSQMNKNICATQLIILYRGRV